MNLVSSKELASEPPSRIFTKLLEFLEETKSQAEYHNTEVRSSNSHGKGNTKIGFVCGIYSPSEQYKVTDEIPRKESRPCLACADGPTNLNSAMHPTGYCAVWHSLSIQERKEKVNCIKCPFGGKETKHTTEDCKKTKFKCHNCSEENNHHTWFCTKPNSRI